MIAEEGFEPVGEVGCLFPVNIDDQSRALSVAVVDNNREFVETIWVSICLELLGNAFGEIIESSSGEEPFTIQSNDFGMVLQLPADLNVMNGDCAPDAADQ